MYNANTCKLVYCVIIILWKGRYTTLHHIHTFHSLHAKQCRINQIGERTRDGETRGVHTESQTFFFQRRGTGAILGGGSVQYFLLVAVVARPGTSQIMMIIIIIFIIIMIIIIISISTPVTPHNDFNNRLFHRREQHEIAQCREKRYSQNV